MANEDKRFDYQAVIDLGEAEQLGGTVQNAQPKVEPIHTNEYGDPAHNVNELED